MTLPALAAFRRARDISFQTPRTARKGVPLCAPHADDRGFIT